MSTYSDAVVASGAVAYYRLGEASGTAMVDAIAASNGTYDADFTLGVTGALVGDPNTAISTTGGGDDTQVATGGASLLNYPSARTAITLECWMKIPSTLTAGAVMVGWDSGSAFLIEAAPGSGFIAIGYSTGAFHELFSAVTLAGASWHHVVAVFTSTTVSLYIDGVQVASEATGAAISAPAAGNMLIDEGAADIFSIDEIAVYPTALSAGTILNHYNIGAGITPTAAAGHASRNWFLNGGE